MSKLKVGNVVKVRKDLSWGLSYYGENQIEKQDATPDMCAFRGKEVTISKVYEDVDCPNDEILYHIKEDSVGYCWTYEMFVHVV